MAGREGFKPRGGFGGDRGGFRGGRGGFSRGGFGGDRGGCKFMRGSFVYSPWRKRRVRSQRPWRVQRSMSY